MTNTILTALYMKGKRASDQLQGVAEALAGLRKLAAAAKDKNDKIRITGMIHQLEQKEAKYQKKIDDIESQLLILQSAMDK